MIQGLLLTDADHAPRLTRERNGYRGTRWYRVNTADEFTALTATGVPAYNDPWDNGSLSSLRARVIETEFIGGIDDVAQNEGALTYVRADYETPGLFGSLPLPQVGEKHTRFLPQVGTYTKLLPLLVTGDPQPRFNAGRGAPATIGALQVEVVTFPDAGDVDLQRMVLLQKLQALNDEAITLPPALRIPRPDIYGIDLDPIPPEQLLFPAETLKYVTFSTDDETGILRVVHTLEVAALVDDGDGGEVSGHHHLYRDEDAEGRLIGPMKVEALYESKSFAGLW
jgi:hypothetical protein